MKHLVFVVLLFCSNLFVFSQDLQRNSTGMGGSLGVVNLSDSKYFVLQSIGQASPVGLLVNGQMIIRQGYQQPPTVLRTLVNYEELEVEIYPNPVDDRVNIVLLHPSDNELFVKLYDLRGHLVLIKWIEYETLYSMNCSFLSSGVYLLELVNGNKVNISQIIKE